MNEFSAATPPNTATELLNELRTQLEYLPAELIIMDRLQCLRMIDQAIELQNTARRLFQFIKFVSETALNPFVKATAEMELATMLQLATGIEVQDVLQILGKVTITHN